jgi:hypothetical protein
MPKPKPAAVPAPTLTCAAFNQTHDHLSFGTEAGWQIVACEPFEPCHSVSVAGGVSVTGMLFTSSLIAIVGHGERAETSPRRLRLWNSSTSSPVFELTFATSVLRVLMNRTRLLVVLVDATHVFELSTMRLLHQLESAPNPLGLAAICSTDASICAIWPGGAAPNWHGKLTIFDAAYGTALTSVAAHHTSIRAVAITPRADLLATASDKGTVVRVHRLPGGECVHVLRRGTLGATIHSLAFSATSAPEAEPPASDAAAHAAAADSAASGAADAAASEARARASCGPLLCAASSTGTVHVWRVGSEPSSSSSSSSLSLSSSERESAATPTPTGRPSVVGKLGALPKWLSAQTIDAPAKLLGDKLGERDIGRVHVKLPADASWCAAAIHDDGGGRHSLYVVTARGEFTAYALDGLTGECTKRDERRLLAPPALTESDESHLSGPGVTVIM